jgi:hypothetical protein
MFACGLAASGRGFLHSRVLPRAVLLVCATLVAVSALPAQVRLERESWALTLEFPTAPAADVVTMPSSKGDCIADRFTLQARDEIFLALKMTYPTAPTAADRGVLHREVIELVMNSRPGRIRSDERVDVGEFPMQRLLVELADRRAFREIRLVLIGSSLYFFSAEWPGGATPPERAQRFFASILLRPEFANARVVEERERWREIVQGSFRLRYDASRWFRDPQPSEDPNSIILLRVDELAEAEFVTSPERNPAPTMEEVVIGAAKETAESVKVLRRAKKYRGAAMVEELRFSVRAEGVNYENHGYFYSGPEGTAQLRAWSPEKAFRQVEGDIIELLDGLNISRGGGAGASSAR